MNEQDRIWELMARKLSGDATQQELEELEQLLQKYPDSTYSFQLFEDLLKPSGQNENTGEAEDAFNKHMQRMGRKETDKLIAGSLAKKERPPVESVQPGDTNRLYSFLTGNGILQNYLKITWRSLSRNKSFSIINIVGLAIGMASAVLILLWIHNELSFDQFHSRKDRIHQAYSRAPFNGRIYSWGITPMVMGPVLKAEHSKEIEDVVRVNWVAAFILKTGDKQLQTEGYVADPGFFTMFDFPLVAGNSQTALHSEHSIVITETLARKLFGTRDALGKIIRIDSSALFTVTGVMKAFPNNTMFKGEYIVPFSYMKEVGWDNPNWWENSIVHTFVLLRPGVSKKAADDRIANIIRSHDKTISNEVFLHPLAKLRLWGEFENGVNTGGYISTVRLFGIIAAFILLIACINYMNLSTARSVKRAREVGIRKVAGARKGSLIGQFIGESILISFLSGILALIIVLVSIASFNKLTDKALVVPYNNPWFWLAAVGFTLFTGILAGSYPAFYLSAFKPVHVLKGSFKSVRTLITPRKALVVLQFTFAITFIICTIVIYKQVKYGLNRDTGFNMDNLAYVYVKGDSRKNYDVIKKELLEKKVVTDISMTNSPVTEIWSTTDDFKWKGKPADKRMTFIQFYVDQDFVNTLQLKMVSGRPINAVAHPGDSNAVVLSETAVREMGFKMPIGQELTTIDRKLHVVGVVKDFIPGIPFAPLYPLVIYGADPRNPYGTITFRLNANNADQNLSKVETVFKKYNPDYPFEHYFVRKSYEFKFAYEQRAGALAALSAGLTIFISCLGLFALAAYTTENRVKEIGVRKVFGASIPVLTALLSKDFLKLVLISFMIASPLAWWAMHSWLQDYAYRITISWWVFAFTGLLSAFIALATVGYQALKAALAKPVIALRTE
jgi:putative ABC transport system permease protein